MSRQAWIIALAALAAGCATTTAQAPQPAKPVPEIRPGILAGYLPQGGAPNSLTLLPAPPAAGSAAHLRASLGPSTCSRTCATPSRSCLGAT